MSENERRIPGERLISRVLSRGTIRPSVGTPAAFYERFGLADPMAERGFVDADSMDDGDLFSFLSAEPYYRALRAQASWRSHRARRRLLGRIAAQSDAFGASATRTLRAAPSNAGTLRVALGARMATDSMLTTLERPVSREELMEELEAEGWTPSQSTRREAPTRRLRRSARRVAPAARQVMQTLEASAPASASRAIARVRHQLVDLPEVEQVRVVKALARSVRGPLRRLAAQAAQTSEQDVSLRPTEVAADRSQPRRKRRKSLRPVMHSTPSFRTLFFEEPQAEDAGTPTTTRIRRERIPAARAPRATRRQAASAMATRGVRTQEAAGRAGPVAESAAPSASTWRSAPATPTARVARRVRALPTATAMSTLRGPDAIEPTVSAAAERQQRIVRRAVVPSANAPLSSSPVRYVAQETASAASASWTAAPAVSVAPAARRAARMRTVAEPAPTVAGREQQVVVGAQSTRQPAPRRRVVVQTATGFQYIAHEQAEEQHSEQLTRRSVGAAGQASRPARRTTGRAERVVSDVTERQGERRTVHGVARAARRASRPMARTVVTDTPVAAGEQATGVSARPAAFAAPRIARGPSIAATPARRSRRVHLAPSPMAFLDADRAETTISEGVGRPASRRRATLRIEQRADGVPQVDSRDVATSVPSPTRYVRDRSVPTTAAASLSASPVRRSRAVAGEGTVISPFGLDERVEAPTERIAARARRVEAVSPSRPAALRAQDGPVASAPRPRRVRVASLGAATEEGPRVSSPQRPAAVRTSASRRTRQVAPTGTLAQRVDTQEDVTPASASTHRASRTARPVQVRDVRGQVVRKAAVGTGSVVYAAARLSQETPVETVSRVAGRGSRKPATSLQKRTRRATRPIGYAGAARDFSLIAPQPAVQDQQASVSGREAPRRVRTPSVRIEASRPLTRADLHAVLSEVSGVIRALERAEAPRVTTPAAQRNAVASAAPTVQSRFAPRLSASPMAVSGRRRARRVAPVMDAAVPMGAVAAATPSESGAVGTRRAAPLVPGASGSTSPYAPRAVRASGASAPRAVRHAEQRAQIAQSVKRRQQWSAAPAQSVVHGGTNASVQPDVASAQRRPMLAQTLGQVAHTSGPVGITQATGPASRDAIPDPGRGWARRAQTGSGVSRPAPGYRRSSAVADATLAEREEPAVLSAAGTPIDVSRPGTILHALARASSAEDVVRVIMERADGLRGVQKELPGPAVAMVERIVRATDEANVQSANVVAPDELAPLSAPRAAPQATTLAGPSTSWNGQRSRPARRSQGAGAGQTMRLANKLMQLVHLAENERRLAEAQKHVRMSQEGAEAHGQSEAASEEAVQAPNMKALQRQVFEAVLREMELSKHRRQEDFDVSIWW